MREQNPQEALDTVVEHYTRRTWEIYNNYMNDEDHPQVHTYMLILERACEAEIHDPDYVDPIDHAIPTMEPNWLLRLEAPDGFELMGPPAGYEYTGEVEPA